MGGYGDEVHAVGSGIRNDLMHRLALFIDPIHLHALRPQLAGGLFQILANGEFGTRRGGRRTFAPDQTSQSFSVAILDNALKEAEETVVLTLSNLANAILGTPSPATLILNTSVTNGSGM